MEREEFYQLSTALADALVELDARTAPTGAERPTGRIKPAVDLLRKQADFARPPEQIPEREQTSASPRAQEIPAEAEAGA